jgi:hypothetical protein
MTDWTTPLVVLAAAAVGASSGPLTEKLRSDTESRNRKADRDAVAKAKRDEMQRDVIRELLAVMNEVEKAADTGFRLTQETTDARQLEKAASWFKEVRSRADGLRVLLDNDEARDLTKEALFALQLLASTWGDPKTVLDRTLKADLAVPAMREQLGRVSRSLNPWVRPTVTSGGQTGNHE